jgi:hypothetical protein
MQRLFVVLGQKSFMRKLVVTSLMTVVVLLGSSGESFAQRINCTEDSLSTNNNGEFLMTLSGKLFETLAGDSIDAMGIVRLTRADLYNLQPRVIRLQVDAIRPTRQCDFL